MPSELFLWTTISWPSGSSRSAASIDRIRICSAGAVPHHDRPGVGALRRRQLGMGVVDVVARAVGEHRVDQVGLDLRGRTGPGGRARGRRCPASRPRSPSRPSARGGRPLQVGDVGVDQQRRGRDRVRLPRPAEHDAVLRLDPANLVDSHAGRLRGLNAGRPSAPRHRYWPVATRSIDRPPSGSPSSAA